MKILLFGKGGQVGWELQRSLQVLGEIVALDFDSTDLVGDFSQPESLRGTVRAVRPDLIVNAAAHTAVDKAESEPELARTLNTVAPAVLAEEAARANAWLVHYSTDYVFDGSGITPWIEDSPTGPLNVYGRTKLEGEDAVRSTGCKHLILRTSWVYGARGENFAKTMLRLASQRDRLAVICDQVGAPTGADLLADITAHVVRMAVSDPALTGTYHAAPSGETSWHAYARFIFDHARRAGRSLKTSDQNVEAIPSSAYPTAARRPLNSRLDTTKLRRTFGLHLPCWQEGVERMLAEILV